MEIIAAKLEKIEQLIAQNNISNKNVLSFKEACFYLDISDSKLYKMVCKRSISYMKPDGKLYFKKAVLDEYMLSNEVKSKKY